MQKLEKYHKKRGTHFEREPKVGARHLDLLKLYKRVVEEGGYDKMCDTRGKPLAWRKLTGEFLPGSSTLTTQAFIVKSAYYKNLAAYEISDIHKREPPPKEILEDVSAKGGDLLSRTVENYFRPASREADKLLGNSEDRDIEGSDAESHKTPKEDKMEVDEPGSTGGRVTRALRHAPPQRVLFQPDLSTRQTRHSSGNMNSPTPASGVAHTNGTYGSGAAMTIANYEPRAPLPSSVKPVVTPGNNPDHFKNLRNKLLTANKPSRGIQPYKGMMLPGTGFMGPNIYIRALLSLQSCTDEEEAYALHHLVKISHERGDKYRFDGFPGLAEALVSRVIGASSLFYDVKFEISYLEEEMDLGIHVLNGLTGTSDLLQRIRTLTALDMQDDLLPAEVTTALGRINEAGLILRNMTMLEENAAFLSKIPSIRDLIVVVLNLPHHAAVVELQHYLLEIAEQLTKFWTLDSQDPLYRSLLAQIESNDRGRIITSLRAIARISMTLEVNNRLMDVPAKALQQICDWLLVEDEELRNACLDFLYQFTSIMDNVDIFVHEVNVESLVQQLVRFLLYNNTLLEERRSNRPPTRHQIVADTPQKLSIPIIEQLVTLDEPERSSQWLRACFEEDPTGEITQIALWSAYNQAFNDVMQAEPLHKMLMPAKDFITNVSSTFPGATAQVLQISATQQKYTIRGIRARATPVDPITRRSYMRCQWHPPAYLNGHADTKHTTPSLECGIYCPNAKALWEHILSTHLKIPKDDSGKWLLETKPDISMTNGDATPPQARYNCHWGGCTHYSAEGSESAYEVGQHVKTHLPDSSLSHSQRKHNRTPSNATLLATSAQLNYAQFQPAPPYGQQAGMGYSMTLPPAQNPPAFRYMNTATDERSDAAGLPLASVLVLRNLARQMAKLEDPPKEDGVPVPPKTRGGEEDVMIEERDGWVRRVFAPVKDQLYFVMAHNLTLREYMVTLTKAIAAGGG
ncbi:RSC complex subunit Rsc9 [Mytilinidion resinicola]|uniref:RSC complex subunit Rsc9 n=1 Tax=Mytilinidion resinicola TaxID=574789 RepID=A0A6A6Y840_9PEZI|nr:RSC complex subunit Rsc9 [Mytilinidion resinicola]KAF2804713.1 RSC complex subunit Rsc9 [Mytilinidion resinicola]